MGNECDEMPLPSSDVLVACVALAPCPCAYVSGRPALRKLGWCALACVGWYDMVASGNAALRSAVRRSIDGRWYQRAVTVHMGVEHAMVGRSSDAAGWMPPRRLAASRRQRRDETASKDGRECVEGEDGGKHAVVVRLAGP